MKTKKQKVGKKGEDIVAKFLKNEKYKIIKRNFQAGRFGEIDIIAELKDSSIFSRSSKTLVFIEVKTKTGQNFGPPEKELTYQKRKKLKRAINYYLFQNHLSDSNWRIDLIAVELLNNKKNIRHYKNIPI